MGVKLCDINEGTKTKGVREQVVDENLWTKRDEVAEGWRRLHIELNNFSPSIRRMIKSRMIDNACSMNGGEVHIRYWWKSQKERDQ
jgi:hypothetical protein